MRIISAPWQRCALLSRLQQIYYLLVRCGSAVSVRSFVRSSSFPVGRSVGRSLGGRKGGGRNLETVYGRKTKWGEGRKMEGRAGQDWMEENQINGIKDPDRFPSCPNERTSDQHL